MRVGAFIDGFSCRQRMCFILKMVWLTDVDASLESVTC